MDINGNKIEIYKGEARYFNEEDEKDFRSAEIGQIFLESGKIISCVLINKRIYSIPVNILDEKGCRLIAIIK